MLAAHRVDAGNLADVGLELDGFEMAAAQAAAPLSSAASVAARPAPRQLVAVKC